MPELSSSGRQAVDDLARRNGFSADAVQTMLAAVSAGNGSMAQFNHPEFSGSGQWMRGGMTMISDMFNASLKGRVDALCADLAALLASGIGTAEQGGGSFQSQSWAQASAQPPAQSHALGVATVSLYVPASPAQRRDWWPDGLHSPSSTGAQNNVRYAYFPEQRRLAIELHGRVTVYDTLDHRIGSVSQQQSGDASISFTSQHGLIDVARLPVVSG